MKTTDDDVDKYLPMFTMLPIAEIEEIVQEHRVSVTIFLEGRSTILETHFVMSIKRLVLLHCSLLT